jgi:hypothetical protein
VVFSQWVADEFSFRHLKRSHETSQTQQQTNDTTYTGAPFKKKPPAHEYEPDCSERQNADLCAQRRMAKAAEDQTTINVVNAVLLFGTLAFTGFAAWAAYQAAKHTARSADVQTRIEQPFLFVESLDAWIDAPGFDPPRMRQIKLLSRNVGKGPGILIEWAAQLAVADSLPDKPVYDRSIKLRGSVIGPGDKVVEYPIFLTDAEADAVYFRQETVQVWGYFLYEDIFGRLHRTGFGFEGHPVRADGSDGPGPYEGIFWARAGGKAYNYDREEDS